MPIRSIQHAFYKAKKIAGIEKPGGVHTLRHSFATHFLESGGGIFQLQKLLGHKHLKTTLIYIHLQEENVLTQSPLDVLSHITINEIFRKYASEYLAKYPNTSIRERKVINSISQCRIAALGGYIEKCDSCGYTKTIYNSCRDRHCLQCQFMKKEQWILSRQNELLPFQYFHAVFTLPQELNSLVYHNRKIIFTLLFQTVKDTLTSICEDKKYLGLKIVFFTILHTWGQKLNYHPHLHCIIPGGGMSVIENKWKKCSKNYLLPITGENLSICPKCNEGKMFFFDSIGRPPPG